MPNGRPGDSRYHDINHLGLEVFGPTCDALVREIAARIPYERYPEQHHRFMNFVETWPWQAHGGPHDPDALYARLLEWRQEFANLPPTAPAPRRGSVPPTGPAPSPAERHSSSRLGRILLALFGFLFGGTVAAILGMVIAMLAMNDSGPGDRTVGYAIDVVFFLMPIAFLCGGIAGALLLLRMTRR
jgi:hypothetical protein